MLTRLDHLVILVRDLDFSGQNGPPVEFEWEPEERLVRLSVRSAMVVDGKAVRRNVDSVIFIENVFDF